MGREDVIECFWEGGKPGKVITIEMNIKKVYLSIIHI